MKQIHILRRFLLLAVLSWALLAEGARPGPLPVLRLTTVDGAAVDNSSLPARGKWILVYVAPFSHSTNTLLTLMNKARHPGLAQKTVILVAGTADQTRKLKTAYPDLAAAQWYSDVGKDAATAIKLRGVPVILGISDQNLRWVQNGIPQDRQVFHSMVDSWAKAKP